MPDSLYTADHEKIAALKREFLRLHDEHRQRKYGSSGGGTYTQMKAQIAYENEPLSEAAQIAIQIDDLLGRNWDWSAEL